MRSRVVGAGLTQTAEILSDQTGQDTFFGRRIAGRG